MDSARRGEGAAAIGSTGLVTINCATVRDALQAIIKGLKITDTAGVATLHVRGRVASLA